MLTGKSLINGAWNSTKNTFKSYEAATGNSLPTDYSVCTKVEVDKAARAAEEAFLTYGYLSIEKRAKFLEVCADEIDALGKEITEIAMLETGLPQMRFDGERGRTCGQLRMFAKYIRAGHHLDSRIVNAQPDRAPMPRAELRLTMRALGPVAVFGASNFPLAFSAAGGDTASALAAGCPVVVKSHSSHPGTSELVARAMLSAVEKCNMPKGTFALLQGNDRELGTSLVEHPLIRAVGFTGSTGGGRALYNLATSRPDPIPFYGELGSINPVFLLPKKASAEAANLGNGFAGSLTMGAGQFCTNPGVVVVLDNADTKSFIDAAEKGLADIADQTMLNTNIASAYSKAVKMRENNDALEFAGGRNSAVNEFSAQPAIFTTSAGQWMKRKELHEEAFGPSAIIVLCQSTDEMIEVARNLDGQLTVTLQLSDDDISLAKTLVPILERKAGRILANGFPTGVEVCDAMMHGGPYPASTDERSTSVGSLAINRFLRPVSYQDMPKELLPEGISFDGDTGVRITDI